MCSVPSCFRPPVFIQLISHVLTLILSILLIFVNGNFYPSSDKNRRCLKSVILKKVIEPESAQNKYHLYQLYCDFHQPVAYKYNISHKCLNMILYFLYELKVKLVKHRFANNKLTESLYCHICGQVSLYYILHLRVISRFITRLSEIQAIQLCRLTAVVRSYYK